MIGDCTNSLFAIRNASVVCSRQIDRSNTIQGALSNGGDKHYSQAIQFKCFMHCIYMYYRQLAMAHQLRNIGLCLLLIFFLVYHLINVLRGAVELANTLL